MNKNKRHLITLMASGVLLAGCANYSDNATYDNKDAKSTMSKSMDAQDGSKFRATTKSAEAREHFNAGYGAFEMQRNVDAEAHFDKAIAADPGFASAYMIKALVTGSTKGFNDNLAKAVSYAGNASPGEQLLIKSFQKGNDGDLAGRLAKLKKLTAMHPDSARALMFEAQAHTAGNDREATVAALKKAINLDPTVSAAHMQLGNAYMFMEPKNFGKAEKHFMKAVELSPNEQNPHDLLGDVHRSTGNLKAAYKDYTRASELAPSLGSPIQQRGHVNTFMGNFDAARADYARSAMLEDARGSNIGGFYMVYHAIVNLHEGNPAAAIAELKTLAAKADASNADNKMDLKINALFNAMMIATNSGDAQASSLVSKVASLLRQEGKELGGAQQIAAREATIAYREGLLAARNGEDATVQAKAKDFKRHVANNTNPRKHERLHELLGMSALYNKDYAGAVKHLSAGDVVNDVSTKYYLAKAHDKNGNSAEAMRLYKELAAFNFNDANYAMMRSKVLAKVAKY